jgi:glycosyltransferase involved in cell wall biosynthesis
MRILVLSHYFWPEPIPKPLELAEALRDEGHSVHAVTGFPNYPDGNLYDGYALRPFRRDSVRGIPLVRTYMYPSHGTSLAGRMINYASFMVTSIAGALLAGRFDVMYVWHPPLSIGVAAAAIALLTGRPFVYDVQDIWPESAVATGFLRPGRLVRWMSRLETFVYRRAARILVVTDGARDNLVRKGVPRDKILVAPHWYDDQELHRVGRDARDQVRAKHAWQNRFVIAFAGNMGVLQGLDTVVEACCELPRDERIVVVMIGDGVEAPGLKELARSRGVEDRIEFVPRQPAAEMARYYAAADALLVHLRASPLAPLIVPSKTVAYLAAAKPIIMAGIGAAADLVTTAGAGVVVPPDDAPALTDAMMRAASMSPAERTAMGRRGRSYFESHFTRSAALPVYLRALTAAAHSATHDGR